MDSRMQQLARRPSGDPATGLLLSAMRLPEKLQLNRPTDLTKPLMQVGAIKRISSIHAPKREYTDDTDLDFLGRARLHWAWPRVFFLSICAVVI